uniref:Uncharacterized protein MANES_02G031700 n=1 Tax=Rhizophora mucronata TaxID=61149 RepID=A0A2P2K542_RHIMU
MTYYEEERVVVPELRMRFEGNSEGGNDGKGDYLMLGNCESEEGFNGVQVREESSMFFWRWRRCVVWYWIKLALLFSFLGLLAAVFLKWVAPYIMDKEIIPMINWETATFSPPVLGVLLFSSVALFPALLLPSSPSMWVIGMTFGYGYGFLIIIVAAAIGVSLPYFIGSLFIFRIQGWLERYPKEAAILRAAGEGGWFHQFQSVTLIRTSPFPYILYNYCAVATNVKYGPYIVGSLLGMVPEIFLSIYTGIIIKALADASSERHSLSAPQVIFNVMGFCASVLATIIFTVYAKRKLKVRQNELLLA